MTGYLCKGDLYVYLYKVGQVCGVFVIRFILILSDSKKSPVTELGTVRWHRVLSDKKIPR